MADKKKKTKQEPKSKNLGPSFNYSRKNDQYIDELMQADDERPFYPKYVYDLACLSCAYALLENLEPEEFARQSTKTHKISAEQLSNPSVDFILKAIGYYLTKDYRILDNVEEYRKICEKISNAGIAALYEYLKTEDFPNSALIRLIKKDENLQVSKDEYLNED